jgi:hypothetical protein
MNNFIIISVFAILLAFSCENGRTIPGNQSLRSELSGLPLSLQKDKFESFTAADKADIWRDKLNHVLSQRWLNPEQRSHLKKALQILSPEVFVGGSDAEQYFRDEFEPTWRVEGVALFGFAEFRHIATLIEDFNLNDFLEKKIVPIGEPADDFDCGCSESSDWCGRSNCNGSCHVGTSVGCGTWWSYPCDGVCVG